MAKFRAKYAFHGEQADDLSFKVGEIIWVYDKPANGWWFGRTEDGRQGIFPYNRVEEVTDTPDEFSLEDFIKPSAGAGGQVVQHSKPKAAPVVKDDAITNIEVKVSEPVPYHGQVFEVSVTLSNGSFVKGGKKMNDFRLLNEALGSMNNKPESIIGLDRTERINASIPLWADNIKLTDQFVEAKMKDRASILSDWLGQRIRQKTADDFLIASWVDSNVDFRAPEGAKKDAAAHLRTAAGKVKNLKFDAPKMAITLYKWLKREDNDITLEKNEILALCNESEFNGWYVGEKVNGDKGLFPFNYVQELSPSEAEEILFPDRAPKKKVLPDVPKRKPVKPSQPVFGQQFGLGTETDTNVYQPVTEQPVFIPTNTIQRQEKKPRARQKVTKYKLSCIEAFDELIDNGVTVEQDGKLAVFEGSGNKPKKGDTVTLYYNGYIWEPQKQELLEFASSDKLQGSKEPGGPLVFKLGANLAIDGIEEVAAKMSLGQRVRVTLAPEKAYGDVGMPPQIPGNAYLVYDLSLEHIDRGGAGGAGGINAGAQRGNVMNRAASSRKQFQANEYMTPAPNADRDKFKRKLPLAHLQKIVQTRSYGDYGIDPRIIHEYLTEEDFIRTFKIERNKWNFLPVYSQNEMLRSAGLK